MRLSAGQMGGAVVRAESFADLWLTEAFCLPHHRAPKHSHELFQFCLVLEGAFTEYHGGRVNECAALSLFSNPQGEVHSNLYHDLG